MRVLYLNPDRGIPVLGDKGASVHVREFVNAASQLGHDVMLVCASLGSGNPLPKARLICIEYDLDESALIDECILRGINPAELAEVEARREVGRLAYDRAFADRVLDVVAAQGFAPDMIYERHALFHESGVEIAHRLGVPRVLEVNAPLVDEQKRFRGLRFQALAEAIERVAFEGAHAAVAVSESVAEHIVRVLGNREKVHVLANGVDIDRFMNPTLAGGIRKAYGVEHKTVIGFVGSFKPWHGVMFLLDVFASLVDLRPDLQLIAVGDGPELVPFRNRVASIGLHDKVITPGRVPHADVPSWFQAMDIAVAPYSTLENFYFSPLKIVEAMAAGRPVVAPDIGQIPEMVLDGETGRLYPPGDAYACATALLALVDSPCLREKMGRGAQAGARRHGWTDVVSAALDLGQRECVSVHRS